MSADDVFIREDYDQDPCVYDPCGLCYMPLRLKQTSQLVRPEISILCCNHYFHSSCLEEYVRVEQVSYEYCPVSKCPCSSCIQAQRSKDKGIVVEKGSVGNIVIVGSSSMAKSLCRDSANMVERDRNVAATMVERDRNVGATMVGSARGDRTTMVESAAANMVDRNVAANSTPTGDVVESSPAGGNRSVLAVGKRGYSSDLPPLPAAKRNTRPSQADASSGQPQPEAPFSRRSSRVRRPTYKSSPS